MQMADLMHSLADRRTKTREDYHLKKPLCMDWISFCASLPRFRLFNEIARYEKKPLVIKWMLRMALQHFTELQNVPLHQMFS